MYKLFSDDANFIDDGVVFANGQPLGLLVPSTLFAYGEDGSMHVCGRRGIAKFEIDSGPRRFWETLIASDCILFGDEPAIDRCREIFAEAACSRTASYFATISTTCEDLLRRIALVRSSNVLILGCGGIGSLAAMNVAGAGVRSMTLVDRDVVESSNLNRQLFWTIRDVGRRKVDVLSDAIEERFPDIDVSILAQELTVDAAKALSPNYDAIIVSADEPLGLGGHVSRACDALVVYGAYFQRYWGYIASKRRSVSNRDSDSNQRLAWRRSPGFIGPSFGPGNTEIAGAMSAACIHYLCDKDRLDVINQTEVWCGNRFAAEDK